MSELRMVLKRCGWLALGVFALLAIGCAPGEEETRSYPFRLDMTDAEQQRILDLQDRQQRDSLLMYLDHPDPSLRYRSAMAFASIRDSAAVIQLATLLADTNMQVRTAAAYALGQSRARQAAALLVSAFRQQDSTHAAEVSNASILEAVGKTGDVQSLIAMSTTSTYLPSDETLVTGQARGIYRFALRGITHPSGTARMVAIVSDPAMPEPARIMAANYLFRATGISTAEHVETLIPVTDDRDPRIRMCIAVALAKSATPQARQVIARMALRDSDYRVRCNILRALHYFPYEQVREVAFQSIDSRNVHVARCAATYLLEHGIERDAARYRSVSRGQLPWEVKTLLYGAANRYLTPAYAITKGNLNTELQEWYRRSLNPYEKAAVLQALAKDAGNYAQIPNLAFDDESPVVRTAGVDALASILGDRYFARDIGTRVTSARREIAEFLVDAIRKEDPGMISAAASALSNPQFGLDDYARAHLETFESALIALDLPKDIEAYDALADCLARLKNETYVRSTVPHNHPVNWEMVTDLADTIRVEVVTSRGNFRMELFTEHAPGTVMNFVELSRDRFFHGKNFHRVVPNFVIQGGCPRGDGYGSLDYTIRSELAPSYYIEEGRVGMASAGNHTECTQWFVTHSPTPHLDGNYTLFGRVTQGMDVVHAIQISDEILEVNIL